MNIKYDDDGMSEIKNGRLGMYGTSKCDRALTVGFNGLCIYIILLS